MFFIVNPYLASRFISGSHRKADSRPDPKVGICGHVHSRGACYADAAPAEEEAEPEKVEVEWPYKALDTVDAGTFYLDVARAGIQYGPHFRMVEKRHIDGKAVVLR